MTSRRSGDGFITCSDGRARWGRFGAAGVVFVVRADTGPEVLLQLRSARAHEGGTWSCPGGAVDEGETPFEGAWRESEEEVGRAPASWRLLGEHVFEPATDWRYTTAVVEVSERFGASMNFETDEVAWVPVDQVAHRRLHPGFASAWPHLRRILEEATSVDPAVDQVAGQVVDQVVDDRS